MADSKNVRLSHEAWSELRKLKFDEGLGTYTDVFNRLFNQLEGKEPDIEDFVKSKFPDDGGNTSDMPKKDKTIVIDQDMHAHLAQYKVEFMRETGATARGPGAVSISDVVMALIKKYKENN